MTVKTVSRLDRGDLRKAERLGNGFLRAPAVATRAGVFLYSGPDGQVVRELRHPDDVFDPSSMATLANVPVTDNHPNATDPRVRILDASNAKRFMAGFTGDAVTRNGDFMETVVTVTDEGLVSRVDSGMVQLSCGYQCDLWEETGVYEGEAYDLRQRNIRYNHLAILDTGRAGPQCSLRLDAADAVQVLKPLPGAPVMEKILINGVEVEVSAAAKPQIIALQARADAADKALIESKVAVEKATAKVDGLESDLKKTKADLAAKLDAADPKVIREAVKARNGLEVVARRVLSTEQVAKLDSMDDMEIKKAVIMAETPETKLEGRTNDYVDARFDHIAETLGKDDNSQDLGKELQNHRNDGGDVPDSEAARLRQRADAENAWKPKKA